MKCKWCGGTVLTEYEVTKCINCSREPSSKQQAIRKVTLPRYYKGNKSKSVSHVDRHLDPEKISDRRLLEQVLLRCTGSGLKVIEPRSTKIGKWEVHKGTCRVCEKEEVITEDGVMTEHLPADPLAQEINDALESVRTNQKGVESQHHILYHNTKYYDVIIYREQFFHCHQQQFLEFDNE